LEHNWKAIQGRFGRSAKAGFSAWMTICLLAILATGCSPKAKKER